MQTRMLLVRVPYWVFCAPPLPKVLLTFLTSQSRKDAHLTQNQFNQLGTVFYVFYLASEFPQNLAMQRFPIAKVLSINICLWAVMLLCHAAAKSFAALATVRTFLALTESAIMPGFIVVTGMFYTRDEAVRRVGAWCKFYQMVKLKELLC